MPNASVIQDKHRILKKKFLTCHSLKNSADDRIDFQEFTAIMTEAPKDPASELTDAFRMFDKNGDGLVSREEIRCILGHDQTIDDAEIENTLQAADKNGDGKIDIHGKLSYENDHDLLKAYKKLRS